LIETLLILIFLGAHGYRRFAHSIRWAAQWGTNARPASDYRAKEIPELQEISMQQQTGGRVFDP
jgi:hypothetical protein